MQSKLYIAAACLLFAGVVFGEDTNKALSVSIDDVQISLVAKDNLLSLSLRNMAGHDSVPLVVSTRKLTHITDKDPTIYRSQYSRIHFMPEGCSIHPWSESVEFIPLNKEKLSGNLKKTRLTVGVCTMDEFLKCKNYNECLSLLGSKENQYGLVFSWEQGKDSAVLQKIARWDKEKKEAIWQEVVSGIRKKQLSSSDVAVVNEFSSWDSDVVFELPLQNGTSISTPTPVDMLWHEIGFLAARRIAKRGQKPNTVLPPALRYS